MLQPRLATQAREEHLGPQAQPREKHLDPLEVSFLIRLP
jgi:hypothetical protein